MYKSVNIERRATVSVSIEQPSARSGRQGSMLVERKTVCILTDAPIRRDTKMTTEKTFHEEFEELKAKHGQESAALQAVRFVSADGNSIAAHLKEPSHWVCERLPDGNIECHKEVAE